MSAAAEICAYLSAHETATRPELQRELNLNEKAVESAMRKLVSLRMAEPTGKYRREGGPRLSPIYRLGAVPFDQAEFSRWATSVRIRRARPCEEQSDAFVALGRALFGAA
jgi:hypothetical protein